MKNQNKNQSKLITRAFTFNSEVKDDSNIEGMAAVYGQTVSIGGWFDEVIERGAFDECDLRDVLFFVNHDISKITLARSRRNNENSTMQITPVENGLSVRTNLDIENNHEARALTSAIKRGDIDGMSMMFMVEAEQWEKLDTEMPLRRITKVKRVVEVSAVNFPAYDETSISARDSALDNADLNALDRAKADFNSKLDSFALSKRKFLFKKENMR